ncbi:hypothetical protein QJQ45_008081 [Haematococcus lacustris]|nr:hypothetical protein QJQ45_008081 [Haematococcus lacustris]
MMRPVVLGQRWAKNTVQDSFFHKAKVEGYVSRAAYKLKEVQQKHHVIKPGAGPADVLALCLCMPCTMPYKEVEVPSRFCDARVQVLQADARTLSPDLLTSYAPQVRGLSAGQGWDS